MTTTRSTEAILAHHLEAVGRGTDEIMQDYTDESVILTPSGPVRGRSEIRSFFDHMLANFPKEAWAEFKMLRQDVEGETAYIVWSAGRFVPLATDTFIVRGGKIVTQTFAMAPPA